MKTVAKIVSPNNVSLSIEVTMTAREWSALLAQINLTSGYPGWMFVSQVQDTMTKALANIEQNHEKNSEVVS